MVKGLKPHRVRLRRSRASDRGRARENRAYVVFPASRGMKKNLARGWTRVVSTSRATTTTTRARPRARSSDASVSSHRASSSSSDASSSSSWTSSSGDSARCHGFLREVFSRARRALPPAERRTRPDHPARSFFIFNSTTSTTSWAATSRPMRTPTRRCTA